MELDDILGRLRTLSAALDRYCKNDKEQEVQGIALPVLDEVLTQARKTLPEGDPVLERAYDVLSPEAIASGETLRAIDALLVTDQLLAGLEYQRDELERQRGPITLTPAPGPFDEF